MALIELHGVNLLAADLLATRVFDRVVDDRGTARFWPLARSDKFDAPRTQPVVVAPLLPLCSDPLACSFLMPSTSSWWQQYLYMCVDDALSHCARHRPSSRCPRLLLLPSLLLLPAATSAIPFFTAFVCSCVCVSRWLVGRLLLVMVLLVYICVSR